MAVESIDFTNSLAEQTLNIEFNIPVDIQNITFYTSPQVAGDWIWEKSLFGLPLFRKVTFYPQESFFPGSEVVIYIVGLKQAWYSPESHEHALEFKAPKIPKIIRSLPEDGSVNIPTDSSINIFYDAPIGEFIEIQFDIKPEAGEFVVENHSNSQEIKFKELLSQDQVYTIDVYQTPRSYLVKSNADVKRGDTRLIKTSSFETVSTPHLKSYEPKGESVLADSVIKVQFDQQMDKSTVENNFQINPTVDGEISWEDENTFVFSLKDDFAKETKYEVSFGQGIESNVGGVTYGEIHFQFTTIGKVKIVSVGPISGATGLDPSFTNVVVEFDQEVDHNSAEQHFSIYPPISSSFNWDGNKMIFLSAGKLSYTTQYNISIKPGIKSIYGLDSTEDFNYSFGTKDNIVSLGIPWYKQEQIFSCNLAAVRMVLAYKGVNVSEGEIQSAIGVGQNPNANWVDNYGVHVGPISSYIEGYRTVSIKSGWSINDLAREIQKGNPVIVWVYNHYSQPKGSFTLPGGYIGYMGMHNEVVRGFIGTLDNPTHILTNDSWRGQLNYSRRTFESIWGYMNNTALVIY